MGKPPQGQLTFLETEGGGWTVTGTGTASLDQHSGLLHPVLFPAMASSRSLKKKVQEMCQEAVVAQRTAFALQLRSDVLRETLSRFF